MIKYYFLPLFIYLNASYCIAQSYTVKVFEVTDTSLNMIFSKEYVGYQNMTLNNKNILIVDSNAVFWEHNYRDDLFLMKKKIVHKYLQYNGKCIPSLCYKKYSDDFIICYGGGGIHQFIRSEKFDFMIFRSAENMLTIKNDTKGRFMYYGAQQINIKGGTFLKFPIIGAWYNHSFVWADKNYDYKPWNLKIYTETSYPVTYFDFNEDETLFGFIDTFNRLRLFNNDKSIDKTEFNEPPLANFVFTNKDSLLLLLRGGILILGKFRNLANSVRFTEEVLYDSHKVLFFRQLNSYVFVFDKKLILCKLNNYKINEVAEIEFKSNIIDIQQSTEGSTLAIVLRNYPKQIK